EVEFTEQRDFLTYPSTPFFASQEQVRHNVETRWMVGRVTFPGHASTTIRVRYETLYHREVKGGIARFPGNIFYYYGTAGYWKGTIGSAVFIIDHTDVWLKNAPGVITRLRNASEVTWSRWVYSWIDFLALKTYGGRLIDKIRMDKKITDKIEIDKRRNFEPALTDVLAF
ncbi:MAG: hypothetical protein V2B18_01470, partial [Pseudomonadota bacterium]